MGFGSLLKKVVTRLNGNREEENSFFRRMRQQLQEDNRRQQKHLQQQKHLLGKARRKSSVAIQPYGFNFKPRVTSIGDMDLGKLLGLDINKKRRRKR